MTNHKKPQCGEYGFIKYRKKRQLLLTLLMLALVLGIFFGGILALGTKNSILSVMAVLTALPMAKFAVSYLILIKRHSLNEDANQQITAALHGARCLKEILLSSSEKLMQADAVLVYNKKVYIYVEENKKEQNLVRDYVISIVKKVYYTEQCRLYTSLSSFVSAAKQATGEERDESQKKKDEAAYKELLLYCVS